MKAWNKNSSRGRKAKAMTKAGTDIWFVGLSVCDSMIGIRRSNGCRVGMKSIPDLFWSEMYLASGSEATVAKAGND